MSWFSHKVQYGGGSGDGIQQSLEESYGSTFNTSIASSNDELGQVEIVASRGWGHEQTTVMSNAAISGTIGWWQRWTRSE